MSYFTRVFTLCMAVFLLSACETSNSSNMAVSKEPVKDKLNFVDISRFDRLFKRCDPIHQPTLNGKGRVCFGCIDTEDLTGKPLLPQADRQGSSDEAQANDGDVG